MARVLGAELYEVNPGRWRLPAAVRYPIQAARTLARVIAKRPRNVIVTNPPFVAALWLNLFARPLGCQLQILLAALRRGQTFGDLLLSLLDGLH